MAVKSVAYLAEMKDVGKVDEKVVMKVFYWVEN